MVERETFARRLDVLREYVSHLKEFRRVPEADFVDDWKQHTSAERLLHLAAEACLDLANHWIAEAGLGVADTNQDTFTVLERAREIGPELAQKLRDWARFRNVLVHLYAEIDHHKTYEAIRDDHGDLEAFAVWALGKLGPSP